MSANTITPHQILLKAPPKPRKTDYILDADPPEVVDFALERLQKAGVVLVEWGALLYRRMDVPIVVKNYSYVVPDEKVDGASEILSTMGLPLSILPEYIQITEGDFVDKGRFHRITRWTSPALVQHLVLYPLSFSALSWMELEEKPSYHIRASSRCTSIYVPKQSALYASILRIMLDYPHFCPTRTQLNSDLSELIGYHLMQLEDGYVDVNDDEEWESKQVDDAVRKAMATLRNWGIDSVWGPGEDWMGDALGAVVQGQGTIENLPFRVPHSFPTTQRPAACQPVQAYSASPPIPL